MPNQWIELAIPTGLGQARNLAVALSGDAVIAVGGRFGTLSEIAFALDAGKPVVSLRSWMLAHRLGYEAHLIPAETAEEAVRKALAALDARGRPD